MSIRKERKRIKPGSAWKAMQRGAALRTKLENERSRHNAAKHDLTIQRQLTKLGDDPQTIALELSRIVKKEIDEDRRHRAKMKQLTKSISEL